MAPTERSMPPEMITIVAPTAMIAMKEVSLASCVRVLAFRNLFTSFKAGSCSPCAFVMKTRSCSPLAFVCSTGTLTRPPKMASNAPSTMLTMTRPSSWKRKARLAATVGAELTRRVYQKRTRLDKRRDDLDGFRHKTKYDLEKWATKRPREESDASSIRQRRLGAEPQRRQERARMIFLKKRLTNCTN